MPNNEQNDPIALAIKKNPCGICRAMGSPVCKGHGGSAGGNSHNGETKNKDATYTSSKAAIIPGQVAIAVIQKFDIAKAIWVQSQLFSDKTINYEAGLLSIESDRLRGNLTFRVKPELSKADIEISHEFLHAVKTEFGEFKNQLTMQGVITKDFTAVIEDNELAIRITPPNPEHYDAFIKHLENKNLLPTQNPESKEDKQQAFNPSPFSKRPGW